MDLAILVVTYNCPLAQSTTLQSIAKASLSALNSVHITIWNNGPTLYTPEEIKIFKESFASKGLSVSLYNTDENFALSFIYNYWLDEVACSHYMILDHDDIFDQAFFTKLHATRDHDVIVPILKELTIQEVTSPTLRDERKSADYFPKEEGTFTGEKISALTSGLCISKDFITAFRQYRPSVFNENFALYRIDVCFFNDLTEFKRLHKNTSIAICNTIFHCQSEYTDESSQMKHFRELEHVFSGCLIRMHSRKRSRRAAFLFIFRQCLGVFVNLREFKEALMCVATKRHPKITKAHNQAFDKFVSARRAVIIRTEKQANQLQ